jgi:uncharacterized integral membrane protein
MRVFYLVILLVLVLAIVLFAVQNEKPVAVRFMDWAVEYPLSVVVAVVYLLGMVSGSTFIGMLGRTVRHATESPDEG